MWAWSVLIISLLGSVIGIVWSERRGVRIGIALVVFVAGSLSIRDRMKAEKILEHELAQAKEAASKHDFHPVSPAHFQRVRDELSSIHQKYMALNPRVIIWFEHSVKDGRKIAEELSKLFQSANIPAEIETAMKVGERHDVLEVYFNRDTKPLAQDVLKALSLLLGGSGPTVLDSINPTGEIAIEIHATPAFELDGRMVF